MYGTEGESSHETTAKTTAETTPAATRGTTHETARESTGDERVDAAMARLGELDGAPTASHPEVFQDVHRRLQDALTGIDGEQA